MKSNLSPIHLPTSWYFEGTLAAVVAVAATPEISRKINPTCICKEKYVSSEYLSSQPHCKKP
jgi:hypothetical protein